MINGLRHISFLAETIVAPEGRGASKPLDADQRVGFAIFVANASMMV